MKHETQAGGRRATVSTIRRVGRRPGHRDRRPPAALCPRWQLTARDLDIVEAVVAHQFLTVNELQPLFFSVETGYKAAARRLKALSDAGLLARHYTPTFDASPAVYCPTQKGVQLLLAHGQLHPDEIDWRGKHNRITAASVRHELAANRLVVTLMLALAEGQGYWLEVPCPHRAGGKRLTRRIDHARLAQALTVERGSHLWDRVRNPSQKGRRTPTYLPVRPDRLLLVNWEAGRVSGNNRESYTNAHHKTFFLEVEIAPKQSERLRQRFRAYREYYRSGGFLRRYGHGDDVRAYPFVVLVTAPTDERRNNLIELAIEEACLKMVWFATYDEVLADPLGAVWIRGEAYDAAFRTLSETEYTQLYRTHRRVERDRFVNAHVQKHGLLET